MRWMLYRWTWRLANPLFVGTTPAGALNRCRLYVAARPLWGALTAELARKEAMSDPRYRQVGKELRESVRLGYLYPAEWLHRQWKAWLPSFEPGDGLSWRREDGGPSVPDRHFRARLLSARPGTAIDPCGDVALEGSLRETECVQTSWRSDAGAPAGTVALVGYVFVVAKSDLWERVNGITTLFVGGDTRYGLGRLERDSCTPAQDVFGARVDCESQDPCVIGRRLFAHGIVDSGGGICGDREALGGWDRTDPQGNHRLSGPAWMPGSQYAEEARWEFSRSGLLELSSQPDRGKS